MKDELLQKLNEKAFFVNQVADSLMVRKDLDKDKLKQFKTVIEQFEKEKDINVLQRLFEIDFRPQAEGACADFTTATSVPIGEKHIGLRELINEIEDLIVEIRKLN